MKLDYSEEYIREHVDDIYWPTISNNLENFSIEFIREFEDKIEWLLAKEFLKYTKQHRKKMYHEIIKIAMRHIEDKWGNLKHLNKSYPSFNAFRNHYNIFDY